VVRAIFIGVCVSVTLGLLAATPGQASLYQPDDPMVVPVRPDGVGEPFPFGEFRRRLVQLANSGNPTLKNADGSPTDRDRLLTRVKALQQTRDLSVDDTAALAADMLRLGDTDARFFVNDALNLLTPRTRDRSPNYFVHTTLAEVRAARGEWADALRYHEAALLDCEMPAKVKGWTDAQRNWVAKLDSSYVPHYLRLRKAEADARPRPAHDTEEPTPLFPLPDGKTPVDPVRFVNDAGTYQPGVLAAAERAKLPPDAVAITQQLLLWFPSDTRLYWLLAELYAADDNLAVAQQIMDECAWSKQYGNRKILMDHREAVTAVEDARRRTAQESAEKAVPISMRTIGIYFAVVVAFGVIAIARAFTRRGRKAGGSSR
jgi:hypothetical protein